MSRQIQQFLFPANPDASVSQKRAEEILKPYLGMISEAVNAAFMEFLAKIDPSLRRKLLTSTRGQVVTNLIWEAVRDNLTGADKDIVFCDKLGFLKIIFNDEIVVRFKRLNAERLAASQGSEQALAWVSNRPLHGIADHLLRVNFGYRPEQNWATCSQFFLTHQRSFTTLDWCTEFQLVDEPIDSQNEIAPFDGPRGPEIKIITRNNTYTGNKADT
jgi:hypothetical protein